MLSLRKISTNLKLKQTWKKFGNGYLEHGRSNAIYTMLALRFALIVEVKKRFFNGNLVNLLDAEFVMGQGKLNANG